MNVPTHVLSRPQRVTYVDLLATFSFQSMRGMMSAWAEADGYKDSVIMCVLQVIFPLLWHNNGNVPRSVSEEMP
jgi:hypothetical protein